MAGAVLLPLGDSPRTRRESLWRKSQISSAALSSPPPIFTRARLCFKGRSQETGMKFVFRSHVQVSAGPVQRPVLGFRGSSLHAAAVAEAAERFIREQLSRKRERTLRH
jgi:hypothetical protein